MGKTIAALFLAASVTLSCAQLVAAVTPPSGLAPGSKYQLIFLTLGTTTATSSDIDYYNTFVNNEAPAGEFFGLPSGLTWHAVSSTPAVNAKDNAPSGSFPVYNTHGQLVAVSSIYTGSLLTAVVNDETGTGYQVGNASVWTGSDPFGVGLSGATLGAASGNGVVGFAGGADSFWIDYSTVWQGNDWALYALSDPITFVPEPATLTLLGSALLLIGGAGLLRWRRRAT